MDRGRALDGAERATGEETRERFGGGGAAGGVAAGRRGPQKPGPAACGPAGAAIRPADVPAGRRGFLAGVGLVAVGGASGAGAGIAAWLDAAAEGPTARTATPAGPGAYAASVTFRAAPSARIVALTIDDGPTREWTPQVLAILRRHGARATFFRVGERALAAPDLVVQTAEAGHEQGNHTWAHDDLTQHDEAFDLGTLARTHELLANLTGRPRRCAGRPTAASTASGWRSAPACITA